MRNCAFTLMVVLGACLSGPAQAQETVAILDPNLDLAVRGALAKPTGPLSSVDLEGLITLSASGQGITSLSGLEWANNLRALNLAGNSITDLSPLGGLTNLTSLDLGANSISDVGALQQLNALTSLMFYNNRLTDLSPLAELTNLSYLELRWNAITNCEEVLPGLTNLTTLYLGGNSISNATFLQGLNRLAFLDLDHNCISDVSPLGILTNLSTLDLGYNRLTNLSQLSAFTNLNSLYLSGTSLSDLSVLQDLTRLTSLTVYSNQVSELLPLAALPNLRELGLSWNTVTNLDVSLPSFTNLTSLWLAGHSLSNLSLLQGLTGLEVLGLRNNVLSNLAGLEGLSNLVAIHADYNRLTNGLEAVASLPRLIWAGFVGNNLNTNAGSPEMTVIQGLEERGVTVSYLPQNQPPGISLPANWIIAANATSALDFYVWDDLTPGNRLIVTASFSDTGLIEDANILIYSTNHHGILAVTPVTNKTGKATITLTVTDEGGLSANALVQVDVRVATNVLVADANLEAAIRLSSGKPTGALTSVDLLALTGLYAADEDITNITGLEWATNLTSLDLGGCSISDVSLLTNLTQLTALSLYGNLITDVTPLTGLTNLSYLDLSWNPITNNEEFLSNFTSVTSLELGGICISNLVFLQKLTQLGFLGLEANGIVDLSPLAGLTNLTFLNLSQNLLTDPQPLLELPNLSYVDLTLNLLDVSDGSPVMTVIEGLQSRGVFVDYLPQREPPAIEVQTHWYVPANVTSSLTFSIWDNAAYPGQFTVRGVSANTSLLPNKGVVIEPGTNGTWILAVTPANNEAGSILLTLTVTNDAGLGTNAVLLLTVMVPEPVVIPDSNLETALLWHLRRPEGNVTSVDLLNLTELDVQYGGISNLSGLEGATNLAILHLDGNLIGDLSPLGGLLQVTSLSLSNNLIKDISHLAGLTNLSYLALGWNWITNCDQSLSGLSNLTSLDLAGNSISNLAFLRDLTQLTTLGLDDNWITDLSALGGLTNLNSLSLRYNLVTNILSLTNLTQLTVVDVSLNLLDTSSDVATMTTIQSLQNQGAAVCYLPQREPPLVLNDQFFGTANLIWQTGGDAPWFGQTNISPNGLPAAQSGHIGDRRESWLEATVTGPGLLSFRWKVSSEADWDWLEFSVADQTNRVSGEVDWQQQVVHVPAGTQTVTWRYHKDEGVSGGQDAAWLGQVIFVPGGLMVRANDNDKVYGTSLVLEGGAFTLFGTLDNGDSLTNVTLNSAGTAPGAPVGRYPIVASGAQGAGLSNYVIAYVDGTLTVLPAALAGQVASSANPALPGESVSFTLSLQAVPPGAGTPTGTVQFKIDGTNAGGAVSLNGGAATFSTASLAHGTHTVAAEYAGDGNFIGTAELLSPSQLINTLPVAGADIIQRGPASGAKVSIAALLGNDSDADGDPLTFAGMSATSANGGTVVSNAGWIFYTPASGSTNSDTFSYLLSDGWAAPVTGTVTVNIEAVYGPSVNLVITRLGNDLYAIRGDGIPGRTYRIESADELDPTNWRPLGAATADVFGSFGLLDSAGSPQRFYRSVFP